jgi:hypothetical protein
MANKKGLQISLQPFFICYLVKRLAPYESQQYHDNGNNQKDVNQSTNGIRES